MNAPIVPIRHPESVERAVTALQAGQLVVIPTDTVYGLAAAPWNAEAIIRLYSAREREPEPALPLLMASADLLTTLGHATAEACRLARRFWPGPLSLILPAGTGLPLETKPARVALRVPDLPTLQSLLNALGGFLVVSSATRSGYPSSITAQEAAEQLGEMVALILDGGRCRLGIPSTGVDCTQSPPTISRHGAIPDEKILAALRLPPPSRSPAPS